MDKRSKLKTEGQKSQRILSPSALTGLIAILVTACLCLLNETGCFQILEWVIVDHYFRLRPAESIDDRILLITVDEPDLSRLREWPLSDQKLAQVLTTINQYKPRVIALDIYRDFPVAPGEATLTRCFENMPNLIGVEKIGGTRVPPPPALAAQAQVAFADIVMDNDGTVRRALLTVQDQGQHKWTLGAAVAFKYLEQEGITINSDISNPLTMSTGVAFPRLQSKAGGYAQLDNRGYQILLNFRGPDNAFETVPIYDVLNGRISADKIRDRIVIIGVIAPSLNDFLYTPYGNSDITQTSQSPGVAIHAHIASQILSTVLDGRSLIQTWPWIWQYVWVLGWCSLGSGIILIPKWQGRSGLGALILILIPVVGLSVTLLSITGLLFFNGWWVASVPALLGIVIAATTSLTASNLKLINDAYVDGLTNVLNRRAFNQQIKMVERHPKALSIILCDIDYFKGFNDHYGHPAGDECLRQVAKAIQLAIRTQDVVARYGGEEFVVILQNTPSQKGAEIANRIREKVQSCQIPHAVSQVSEYVSISCGLATRPEGDRTVVATLVSQADQALYKSKLKGRNTVTLWDELSSEAQSKG